MVSLVKLSQVTEEDVNFQIPLSIGHDDDNDNYNYNNNADNSFAPNNTSSHSEHIKKRNSSLLKMC